MSGVRAHVLSVVLASGAAASAAEAQAVLGTEAGCAFVEGRESAVEDRYALLHGHLTLRDATCQIQGVQTGTMIASCNGDMSGRFRAVLGIAPSPDGGVVLTLPEGGGTEVLYPCE
ncbi:hypothetical protein [Roseivivax isoporae]|uniref:Uncharacterized protein n=1 Tax=Roseivivax isoporae LMG 25204 TaxID=1449351 RepID=X7FDV2_9RHOB|nr:hypothetical protein [Roseivivax isoporae]ETX30224.1 hypothetical protein RISW2_18335 [Roseivivax isoporae LMG 25204]